MSSIDKAVRQTCMDMLFERLLCLQSCYYLHQPFTMIQSGSSAWGGGDMLSALLDVYARKAPTLDVRIIMYG